MPQLASVALPQKDESLFSWLSRFAALQGMTARRLVVFCSQKFPEDPDRVYKEHFFQRLSELSGQSVATLTRLGFARYDGFLFEQDRINPLLPWLPQIRLPKMCRTYRLFFCPSCLEERAYFRLNWRLGFSVCCPRHKVWLSNSECHDDLTPVIRRGFRDAESLPAPDEIISMQNRWLKILEKGWAEMGQYGVQYSFVWFFIARLISRLLLEGGCFVEMRRIAEKALGLRHLQLDGFRALGSSEKFYELSIDKRARILLCVDWLMQEYPQRFISICKELGIPSRFLGKKCKNSYPFALSDPLLEHLHRPHYKAPAAEIEALKAVLRHKAGGKASLNDIRNLSGYKLTTRRELSDSIHKGVGYGEGRYWKLDGVAKEVKMAVRRRACDEGITVGHWVERALQQAASLAPNEKACIYKI